MKLTFCSEKGFQKESALWIKKKGREKKKGISVGGIGAFGSRGHSSAHCELGVLGGTAGS